MAHALLPFLMYMMLGRSIDLRSYQIGADVFDHRQYDETKIDTLKSTYSVLQDNTFPFRYMGFPVDLVLRMKSGYNSPSFDVGLNGLLTDTAWKQKSVVVIAGTAFQTVTRALKEDAATLPNWTTRISKSETHYANSIVYGGLMFVVYRFKCDNAGDVETVRKTLTDILGVNGNIDASSAKLWQKALSHITKHEEIRGKVHIEVERHSTFPFKHDVSSFGRLLEVLGKVRDHVGPVGKPIAMELAPLHALNPMYPDVTENHDLDGQLEEFDNMYDDVKNTKNSLQHWVDHSSVLFSEEDEEKIAQLVGHLDVCLKLFHQIASEASVYKTMDPEVLNRAVDLYSQNLTHYSYTYYRLFRKLKEDIDAECKDTFLHKIKGLLQVDDSERIEVGDVEGGLEECKAACLAVPECRSIGYVDRMLILDKVKTQTKPIFKLIKKFKQCYIYFRSSSTADVLAPVGASITGVYDRKCL